MTEKQIIPRSKRHAPRPKTPAKDTIESLSSRLDAMHEILERKNAVIRLLAMGDCTASELGLSDF